MYIFKPWHQWFPLFLTMAGFYITRYYEKLNMRDWNVDAVFIIFQFFAVTIHAGMLTAGLMYQRYMTDTDTPPAYASHLSAGSAQADADRQVMPKEPEQIYPSTPLKYGEMHQYAQTFKIVTERKEKQFCKTLLGMRTLADDDSKVDLREDTWKEHFGGRDNYVESRTRFELAKAFGRKDRRGNSPFIVIDWRKVQLVAQGETLR